MSTLASPPITTSWHLYTAAEVAEMLRVEEKTIENYRKRGKLRGVPIGREIRFTLDQVKAFVDAQIGTNQEGERSDLEDLR